MNKKTNNSNDSLLGKMREMEVGHAIVVPVSAYSYNTVRKYACELGFALDRKYSSHQDRATRTFVVTRQA